MEVLFLVYENHNMLIAKVYWKFVKKLMNSFPPVVYKIDYINFLLKVVHRIPEGTWTSHTQFLAGDEYP